jgi:hypothetical protein
MSKLLMLFIGFALTAALAQNTHLQITSSIFDANTHSTSVSLANHSQKNIIAYVIKIEQLDAVGNPIGIPLTIGTDNVLVQFYGPNTGAMIVPGSDLTRQYPLAPAVSSVLLRISSRLNLRR